MALVIVREGSWLYDGAVEKPVDIIGLDYDYFESDYGAKEELQRDEHGLIYYVRFRKAGEIDEPTWVDTDAFATPELAMQEAELRAPSPITWKANQPHGD